MSLETNGETIGLRPICIPQYFTVDILPRALEIFHSAATGICVHLSRLLSLTMIHGVRDHRETDLLPEVSKVKMKQSTRRRQRRPAHDLLKARVRARSFTVLSLSTCQAGACARSPSNTKRPALTKLVAWTCSKYCVVFCAEQFLGEHVSLLFQATRVPCSLVAYLLLDRARR
jgi:hypothetical protein